MKANHIGRALEAALALFAAGLTIYPPHAHPTKALSLLIVAILAGLRMLVGATENRVREGLERENAKLTTILSDGVTSLNSEILQKGIRQLDLSKRVLFLSEDLENLFASSRRFQNDEAAAEGKTWRCFRDEYADHFLDLYRELGLRGLRNPTLDQLVSLLGDYRKLVAAANANPEDSEKWASAFLAQMAPFPLPFGLIPEFLRELAERLGPWRENVQLPTV